MTQFSMRTVAFLSEMGVTPLWMRRGAHQSVEVVSDELASSIEPEQPQGLVISSKAIAVDTDIANMDWEALKVAVAHCTKCDLCRGRQQTVFGVGDEKAKWLFIGEGPGRDEDERGEPFVGPSGKLLDNMLSAMGKKRGQDTYITNIVKCRPTDDDGRDRPPTAEEVAACLPYLNRQIVLMQPSIMVALGKTAAVSLLKSDPLSTTVSSLRGQTYQYLGIPLVVTYHPAYLLRSPTDKKKTWADLCLAMTTYNSESV